MISSNLAQRSRGRGFTLVELMIAVTIGLLLTLVVAQLFIGSRRTYGTTDDLSRMQENARYTYQLLTRTVHLAGYRSSPSTVLEVVFTAPNQVLAGTEGDSATFASDTITVAYQGSSNGPGPADGSVVNCQGAAVTGGVTSLNTFAVRVGRNGSNALFCSVDGGVTFAEIVPDVDNMQILYGADTDANAVVDTYVPADLVANMNNVRSVRFALLFRTPNPGAAPAPDTTTTYVLNDLTVGPFNDTRLRRAVTMTVNMRNRTP